MSYVETNLIPGESVLYRARLHWVVIFWPMLIATGLDLLGVGAVILAFVSHEPGAGPSLAWLIVGLVLLVAAALVMATAIVKRNATEIAVTNRRVLIKTGIVERKTTEILLSKVESVGVDETLGGRFLGYGTVTVRGTGGTPEPFPRIASPLAFRRAVQGQIESLSRVSDDRRAS